MQNPIEIFWQSSIVFEKLGFWSENLKTLTSSNYPTVQCFLLKLRKHFLLTNVYKRVCGIFFCLNLELFTKIKKTSFLHTCGIMVQWLSLLHNFIQQSLNSGSAQVQILLVVCRRFVMVRISDNGPGWK